MRTDNFSRGKTAIVGASTFGIGEAPGFSSIDLAAKASGLALSEAGLTPADVDGLFICTPDDMLSGLTFAEYLGIHPRITDNNRTGGSAFQSHVFWASAGTGGGAMRRGTHCIRKQPEIFFGQAQDARRIGLL